MVLYIMRRIGYLALILMGMSLIIFLISHALPGDPAIVAAGGRDATAEMIAHARIKLGLDKPVIVQYFYYLGNILKGDFGRSIVTRRPVIDDIKLYFPATLELSLAAIIFSSLLGIPLGTYMAINRGKYADGLARFFSLSLASMPVFWLGLMAVLVFYRMLGILPAGGRLSIVLKPPMTITGLYTLDSLFSGNFAAFADSVKHLLMPMVVLSGFSLALISRTTRSCMLEVLGEDYIRTARSKGLKELKVIYKHALKNAMVPIITVIGIQLGQLMGGVVLTETIFSWPGLGLYAVSAIDNQDYPIIMMWALVFSFSYAVINLLVDLCCHVLNPQLSK